MSAMPNVEKIKLLMPVIDNVTALMGLADHEKAGLFASLSAFIIMRAGGGREAHAEIMNSIWNDIEEAKGTGSLD